MSNGHVDGVDILFPCVTQLALAIAWLFFSVYIDDIDYWYWTYRCVTQFTPLIAPDIACRPWLRRRRHKKYYCAALFPNNIGLAFLNCVLFLPDEYDDIIITWWTGGTRSITALNISQLLDWLQAGEGYSSIQVGQPSPAANTYFTSLYCKILFSKL